MDTTKNYCFQKPSEDAFLNVTNANMDDIDEVLKEESEERIAADARLRTALNEKEELIKNVSTKTSIVDADTVPLSDSTASNATKKITFTNIKASLKSYFDGLYNKYEHPTSFSSNQISKLYKVAVNTLGHVTGLTEATTSDITALGILPASGGELTGSLTSRDIKPTNNAAYRLGNSSCVWQDVWVRNLRTDKMIQCYNTSTSHPSIDSEDWSFSIGTGYGVTSWYNMVMWGDIIQGRGYGKVGKLHLNYFGGAVCIGANDTTNDDNVNKRTDQEHLLVYGRIRAYKSVFEEGIQFTKNGGSNANFANLYGNNTLSFGVSVNSTIYPHNSFSEQRNIIDFTYGSSLNVLKPRVSGQVALGNTSFRWGELWTTSGTITGSDEKLKMNFKYYNDEEHTEFFDKINAFYDDLRPMFFEFKPFISKSGRKHMGFGAMEVGSLLEKHGLTPMDFAGYCKDPVYRKDTYYDHVMGHNLKVGEAVREKFTIDLPSYKMNFGYIIFKSNSSLMEQPKLIIHSIRCVSSHKDIEDLTINLDNIGVGDIGNDEANNESLYNSSAKILEDNSLEISFDRQYTSYTLSLSKHIGERIDLSNYERIELDVTCSDKFIVKLEESGELKDYDASGFADEEDIIDYNYALRYEEFIPLNTMRILDNERNFTDYKVKTDTEIASLREEIKALLDKVNQIK